MVHRWLLPDFEQVKKNISHFADLKQVREIPAHFFARQKLLFRETL